MRKALLNVSIAAVAVIAGPAEAAVTFLDARVATTSSAQANSTSQVDTAQDEAFGSFRAGLVADTNASASDGAAFATADSMVGASFIDAAQGGFLFDPRSANVGSADDNSFAAAFFGGEASYSFRIDTASLLTLDYVTFGGSESTGAGLASLGYFDLLIAGPSQYSSQIFANTNGTTAFGLTAGDYTFSVFEGSFSALGTAFASGAGTANISRGGAFNFSIADAAAVPEPSTWAMLIVGFGAVGFAMRRSRQRVRVAYS